jgi:hypothetical protein
MSLYESNYLRFLQLAGHPMRLRGTLISRVAGDCELRLEVLEHMPYTSMLTMTYQLPSHGGGCERLPDLSLRAYHDARLLEADQLLASANQHNPRRPDPRKGERELHQRWTRNMMLNKWLEYCVERGHRFTI